MPATPSAFVFTTKSNSYQLSKDKRLMLAQNIIVSLEEIDSMTTKEINQQKAFVTMPSVLRWISTIAYLAQTKSPKIRPSDLGA